MPALKVGNAAPDFSLPSADGSIHSLTDFRGKKVILYFYPKDDTPGCTREACEFRDSGALLLKKGAVVIGVSTDSLDSHKKFAEKYNLPFMLLSDQGKKVVRAYGAWKKKSLYGRDYMGTERITIIIDERGKILRIFPKVKVDGHVEEILNVL